MRKIYNKVLPVHLFQKHHAGPNRDPHVDEFCIVNSTVVVMLQMCYPKGILRGVLVKILHPLSFLFVP